jgi:hypothetical protein
MDDAEIAHLFDKFAEPKQILFLSADLVGSTALKQKKRKVSPLNVHHPDTQEWASTIQFFFNDFSRCLDEHWSIRSLEIEKLRNKALVDTRLGSKPILWKMIGDELVYRKHVRNRHQVKETVDIWINAILQLYGNFREKRNNPEISIKCTAWIGEFPIQNKILLGAQLSGQPGSLEQGCAARLVALQDFESKPVGKGLEIDFIGPAIDIGFRLTKKATPRKFILSIDTIFLYVLSELSGKLKKTPSSRDAKIHYDGAEALPGVLGGLPYPLFWIDMIDPSTSEALSDGFRDVKPIDSPQEILDFFDAFYKEQKSYIDTPYITTDESELTMTINEKPAWYEEEKKKLRQDMIGECDIPDAM